MLDLPGPLVTDGKNGNLIPHADPEPGVLIGSLYVEFLAFGREIRPRMLGHVPDNAAVACAELIERLAQNMKARGSRIVRVVP